MKSPLTRTVTLAACVDVLAVLVFVLVGQRSHVDDPARLGALATAAPFLLGMVIGWLGGRVWRDPLRLSAGIAVWALTSVVGLLVRAAITHRLPLSFVLVASASLAVLLIGWRLVASAVNRVAGRASL